MRKISLNLDSLEVASFETTGVGEDRGTVAGHVELSPTHRTCDGSATPECFESNACPQTDGVDTCAASCYTCFTNPGCC
jgi:hypothetical protein